MNTLIKKAQHRDADAFVALMQENMKDMYKIAVPLYRMMRMRPMPYRIRF